MSRISSIESFAMAEMRGQARSDKRGGGGRCDEKGQSREAVCFRVLLFGDWEPVREGDGETERQRERLRRISKAAGTSYSLLNRINQVG